MAFSWEHCIERAEKMKKRQDKCKASQNASFVAKTGKSKIREMLST